MSDHKEFGFGFESTAEEVSTGVDLTGRRAIVTGGASGIGVETARVLAARGAEVTIPARDLAAGERVAAEILASTGNKVRVAHLDLADPASARRFAADWTGPLHLLVANAGVMAPPLTRTNQGWELQFATNHLGHFTLITGLHDALAAAGGARVVVTSSVGHLRSEVHFDDLHFERREYTPFGAYGQSKTANILFAVEADRRWQADGIRVNALHPGAIHTNLARHVDMAELERLRAQVNAPFQWKSIEQGAATQVLLATSPLVEGIGGEYFEDCHIAAPQVPDVYGGVAAYAKDPANAAQLWDLSLELTTDEGK
jgi:NAD(P)-dependent dehydrogenase (short-subunit alcohol dehydrogenase family)